MTAAPPSSTHHATDLAPPEAAADPLVGWILKRFADRRMVITTAFGMEGCALIDMCAARGVPLDVVYLDTMFLFPETYALRDRMVERYPHLTFLNRGPRLTPADQEAQYGPELWRSEKDRCCSLRKVEPMRAALADYDVWITALTSTQSDARAALRAIEWDRQFDMLKVSPLVHWDRARVWDYVRAHDVPFNPLHLTGYPSIGCTHCTVPVPGTSVTDYTRLGRWSGSAKQECGLHRFPSGR